MTHRPYFPSRSMRKRMVRWFYPTILLKTLLQLLRTKIVGSQLDTRELQSLAELDSHRRKRSEPDTGAATMRRYEFDDNADFVFDFLADTGDGWDSTYSVASLLARDKLHVPTEAGSSETVSLRRGSFVVLGGDAVYPLPSLREYRDRLVRPFRFAWHWCWRSAACEDETCDREMGEHDYPDPAPRIYVLPGNHDWYDSLSSFKTWFCNVVRPRRLGAWQTDQSRSYFALELPKNWYLFAFDFGINGYSLDNLQFNYFCDAIDQLDSDARIILVAAEPDWIDNGVQNPRLYRRYQRVERIIAERFTNRGKSPPKIFLNLSGDTHNYQHYVRSKPETIRKVFSELCAKRRLEDASAERACSTALGDYYVRHKIVAGGGGAFLHPTHALSKKSMRTVLTDAHKLGVDANDKVAEVAATDLYEMKACYPSQKTSRRLAVKAALLFLPRNIRLAAFIATSYLLLAWPMREPLSRWIVRDNTQSILDIGLNFMMLVISVGLITLFTLMARTRPHIGLAVAGFVHGVAQVLLLYGGYALAYIGIAALVGSASRYTWATFPILRDLIFFVVVGGAATALLGWALWLYLAAFNGGKNELFSSASISTHKNFLRLAISKTGQLTVYPIAVPKPVTYSMPLKSEVDEDRWDDLSLSNGVDWNRRRCYAQPGESQLVPEQIEYYLIEQPIVIDPR